MDLAYSDGVKITKNKINKKKVVEEELFVKLVAVCDVVGVYFRCFFVFFVCLFRLSFWCSIVYIKNFKFDLFVFLLVPSFESDENVILFNILQSYNSHLCDSPSFMYSITHQISWYYFSNDGIFFYLVHLNLIIFYNVIFNKKNLSLKSIHQSMNQSIYIKN